MVQPIDEALTSSRSEQLQEQRNELAAHIVEYREHLDQETGAWDSSEREEGWQKLNTDYEAVLASLEGEQNKLKVNARLAAVETAQTEDVEPMRLSTKQMRSRPDALPTPDFNSGLRAWMKAQVKGEGALSNTEAATAKALHMNPQMRELEFAPMQSSRYREIQDAVLQGRRIEPSNADMVTGTGAAGGYTIPAEEFVERLEVNALYYGPMRQLAELVTTSSGEPLTWPTFDDTANSALIVAEVANIDDTGSGGPTGTYGQFQLSAYKFSSQTITVSYEMLQDTHVDLLGTITRALGERIGRGTNSFYTVGVGTTEPHGVSTAVGDASDVVTATASGTITSWTELVDLVHAVDIAYRTPSCGFMCNDLITRDLRKLVDGDLRPIWGMGANGGQPDTLLGYRLYPNNHMVATMAVSTISILFGDYSTYKIRRVGGPRFYRLQELYRATDREGFVVLVREDGGLLQTGTAAIVGLEHPV